MTDDEFEDFKRLQQELHDGSEDAAREFVNRYGEALRRAARRILDREPRLRSKLDSIDIVQAALKSIFVDRDLAACCESPEKMVAYILEVARNKARMEVRRLKSPKNDVRRERPLDKSAEAEHLADNGGQPPPIDVAIANERLERLLNDQPEHYREVVQLKLSGKSCPAIAAELGLDQTTVRRILKRLSSNAASA